MARLTWENVNAPSFAGIGDNYRVMSQLLGNATRSGLDMIDTIRNTNAEGADRAILQRMVGVQDPAAYDPNAIIGADGSRASLATLRGVGDYADTLLNRAVTRGNMDWTNYGRDRVRTGNEILDNNADAINTARSLAVSGDIGGAQRILGGIQGLRPEQFNEILGDVDQFGTRSLARDVTSQRLTQDRYGFGRQIRSDNAGDAATAAIAEVLRSAGSPQDARVALERLSSTMSPEAFSRAVQGLGGFGYGNVYQPFGAGGGGSVGGLGASSPGTAGTQQGNPYDTVVGFGQFGNSQKPITQMTIGEAIQFGKDVLIPETRGNASLGLPPDKGSSAMGAYQITQGTLEEFAPRVLGANWRDQPMSPENQERIAEAIFEARKGGNLKETWAALPNSTPGAYANRSWNEVRQEIAQREVGAQLPSAAEAGFAGHMASRRLEERLGQNNATGISRNYAELVGDTRDQSQVADALRGEGGPFRGTSRDFLIDQINHIVNRSNGRINPAMAGAMMAANIEQSDNFFEKLFRGPAALGFNDITPNLGGGIRINDRNLRATMDDYLTGRTSQRTLANESMAAMAQVQQQAQGQYQAALQQYQAALMDAQTRPGAAQNIPRYREAVQRAAAQLEAVQTQIAGNQNWRPDFDQTEVPTPASAAIDASIDTSGPEWQEGPFGLWRSRRTPAAGGGSR